MLEAGVTSLVDGVLGDIGDIVRGILQTRGEISTHVLLLCGEQGWRCQGKGTARPQPHVLTQARPRCAQSLSTAPMTHHIPTGGKGDGLHVVVGNDLHGEHGPGGH